MATDKWLTYGGTELVNLSRSAQLAEVLGITALWTTPESVQWIEDALGGVDYDDITEAPWYDAGHPASEEFAGVIPLSIPGLDDSTREATTTEYITNGGNSNKPRNKTLPIVANVILIASTDRGADYGKRWLDRVLAGDGTKMFCSGSNLTYFQYNPTEDFPPQVHRRDVSVTRATTVTRKRSSDCSVLWTVTFTWTANDPFEYSTEAFQFEDLGGEVEGPGVSTSGSLAIVQDSCPVYDYSPIYDPLYPALVPPPSSPSFYPEGWGIVDGMTFDRFWVRLNPVEPSVLRFVPVITLNTDEEARFVRVSIWPSDADTDEQCDPLFSAVVSYLPVSTTFYIDGEQQAAYVWDGVSPLVRRADTVLYAPDASPVDWTAFNDPIGLLVTLDIFADSSGSEGAGTVRAGLSLVSKSD